MSHRTSPRGFTLLELLVATTLVALLSLTVLIGMRVGFGAWQRGERRLEVGAREDAVQEYLGRALASAVAYVATPKIENLPREFLPFQGNSQGMRWVTTYTANWRERSGLAMVECFLVGDGDKRRLVLQEFPVRSDGILAQQMVAAVRTDPDSHRTGILYRPFDVTEEARPLVTGVRDARFEFLKVTTQGSSWQTAWDAVQEKELPAAVRVWIQASAGEQIWTVPIRSQLPASGP